jgi:hypothetical protein
MTIKGAYNMRFGVMAADPTQHQQEFVESALKFLEQ